MPNPVPEKRIGLALLFIGAVSLYVFILSVWAGNKPSPLAFFAIVMALIVGWGLRARFKSRGAPPAPKPPPVRGGGAPAAKGGLRLPLPFGRKPEPPPPPPPPPQKGLLDFLKPKTKNPPKK